jgi:hypothetical protein
MQLVKQTRENPDPECRYHTWEVFLLVATLFPPTRNSEGLIKGHIAECADDADPRVSEIVKFTFIRFRARCGIGKAHEGPFLPGLLCEITSAHLKTTPTFGSSLYEQVWCQRSRFPLLPIPVMMHQMASALLARGGEGREGVFRLPGNMKTVNGMQRVVGEQPQVLDKAEIHDLGSLLKAWFSNLPQPIVHADVVPRLKTAHEDHTFIEFANGLPDLEKLTLKYLVGFLRRMACAEAVTKMGAPNLAMVFAPNVVDIAGGSDVMQVAKTSDIAKEFLIALINDWDVTDVYPPSQEMLAETSDGGGNGDAPG